MLTLCAGSSFPYAQRHAILSVRGRNRQGINSCRLNAKHFVKIVLDRLNFGVLHTEKSNLIDVQSVSKKEKEESKPGPGKLSEKR